MTQYIYDADGNRVAKGTISVWSCDVTQNGFVETNGYVIGPSGEQVTEVDGNGAWVHTNVYAAGKLVATYDNDQRGLHFHLTDWVGTQRVQTDYAGNVEQTCSSGAFGDAQPCINATEQFFTGKERDAESGLDYFGARYYGSSMGRFMSPDPSGLYFADPSNPQSLNLYSYGGNNPLTNVDPTGLDCVHINNDTGAYESFESGDCNNSTEALANTGHYVDGTVNQISFNGQNQVNGYSASTGDGFFDTPGSNSGASAVNLNPYTGALSNPGQSVSVTATTTQGPNSIGSTLTTLVPGRPLQTPNPNITHFVTAYHPLAAPKVTGDPACYGAPDAVSAIHAIRQGNAQGQPQASTDGQFGTSIWQNTTQGNRPFGNAAADTGFNAGFMGLDYAVSVANCLQGH